MAKSGVVFASATEDMDCLTFGTKVLLRHMTFSEAKWAKQIWCWFKIFKYNSLQENANQGDPHRQSVVGTEVESGWSELTVLGMLSYGYKIWFQFIDLCILLGCDYCEGIKGIGPKKAMELITQYRCLEEILKHIDQKVRCSCWCIFSMWSS